MLEWLEASWVARPEHKEGVWELGAEKQGVFEIWVGRPEARRAWKSRRTTPFVPQGVPPEFPDTLTAKREHGTRIAGHALGAADGVLRLTASHV